MAATIITAVNANGERFFWTGKAGAAWVSRNAADALCAFTLEACRAKAAKFNAMTALHGLRFVAVNPEK